MTESQAIEAILARWMEGWLPLHPSDPEDPNHVPFTFGNESFKTDELGVLGAWVRVSIFWTGAEQTTQGTAPYRKWERRGTVSVQIFGPPNKGTSLLARLATDARTVLQGRRLDDTELNLFEGASEKGTDEVAWAAQSVSFRFSFEETS